MTDRELWTKTMKTVGAMVGGSVVFLGSMSLLLLALGGSGHATPTSEARAGSTLPAMSGEGKGSEAVPTPKSPRHGPKGELRPESRPGESI